MSAILNRDLIRPWIQLEYGPQKRYPRLRIGRPKTEDLTALATSVEKMVRLGMEIEEAEVRSRFGFSEPKPGAKLLKPMAPPQTGPDLPPNADAGGAPGADRVIERDSSKIKAGAALPRGKTALQAEGASAAISEGASETAALAARLGLEAQPEVLAIIERIEAMIGAAGSMGELREMLATSFDDIPSGGLAARIAAAMLAADFAGREGALNG